MTKVILYVLPGPNGMFVGNKETVRKMVMERYLLSRWKSIVY